MAVAPQGWIHLCHHDALDLSQQRLLTQRRQLTCNQGHMLQNIGPNVFVRILWATERGEDVLASSVAILS